MSFLETTTGLVFTSTLLNQSTHCKKLVHPFLEGDESSIKEQKSFQKNDAFP